jgi:DNA-binding CsgD family transcriptional regulator
VRVSDTTDLRRFWRTDVYSVMHGHSEGRFPTALTLDRNSRSVLFVGIHRQVRDLDDTELECLAELGRPIRAALEFRRTLDRAIARLGDVPGEDAGPFSPGEAEVIALVSLGWTTTRIARRLGLSESGVRHRLASARDRIGAGSRAELVSRWAQLQRAI